MNATIHRNAGDALVAALTLKERQFDCILVRDFWSFETDKWTLVSPTGKSVSVWAHHSALRSGTSFAADFQAVTARWQSDAPVAPDAEYCAKSYWSRGRAVKCTRSEMASFAILAKMTR